MKAVYKSKANLERQPLQDLIPMDTPMRVTIETALACNFHCFFCFHNKETAKNNFESLNQIMPFELAKKCIDDLKLFPRKIKLLSFFLFGEPLLNKSLPEMIHYAKFCHVAELINITTNASLLTHDTSDKLIAAGLDRIYISIYGLSSVQYQKISSVNLDFKKLLDNIYYFFTHKKNCKVHIKICDVAFEKENDESFFYETFSDMCDEISVEHIAPLFNGVKYEDKIASTDKNVLIYEGGGGGNEYSYSNMPTAFLYADYSSIWCCFSLFR
jgi:sulfatase maturation enzyme AslB (radical SAM superfamily)